MRWLLSFLFIWINWEVYSQIKNDLGEPLSEISVKELDQVSLDTRDQIYVSNLQGDIFLFDATGKQLNYFSPARQAKLSQLEAAWSVTIFSFSEDLQEYRILDRFLNPIAERNFLDASVNLPKAATLGNNNIVWVWDESDLSLKRMDYLRNLILDIQPLNLITSVKSLQISALKEYKNRLFALIPNEGVLVFDNQGNLLLDLKLPKVEKLSLYKDYLLWLENGNLMGYNLSQQTIENIQAFTASVDSYVFVGQTKLLLVQGEKIEIYPIPDSLKELQ
ncbi:hypothetical protein E4S40_10370 [Algoriphagus kandeliae]|uniref:Uncharacterized protein n=1 Tax=Algoriphagus kandeliae TaxID=2562278 RepID=A0A4Y9QQD9_9BACT|nr:hypothetical protein [Algoriphagus kandeliae]TFV94420.1 hypothetical protein E4S40_10370 [Algoriphagus kandeliae]